MRWRQVTDAMLARVELDAASSVFEIGCGDGFLTEAILQMPIARLWVFEIDPEWAVYVRNKFPDPRMTIFEENFLDLDFSRLSEHTPWTLLANLPYVVTFPILHRLQQHRDLLKEGVIMVQEEVAEKLLKKYGRGYGYISLFFQYYFEWEKLQKVPPAAFDPPPKVFSRLLYFKPKKDLVPIPDAEQFWKFIKICFSQPRRTLRNNLKQAHYDVSSLSDQMLNLRAQQMSMDDFLQIWQQQIHSDAHA